MKNIKSNRAITLIALVITIVVLIILATVVINLSLGNNGILNRAKTATEQYQNAQSQEEIDVAKVTNEIDDYVIASSGRNPTAQNSENTMSGIEHFTGEYYLDGRPIYARTYYVASLPSSTTYSHGISNVNNIWLDASKSCIVWNNGNTAPFNYGDETISWGIMIYNISKTGFFISVGSDRRTCSAYVTLNYTKTDDTATITPNPAAL